VKVIHPPAHAHAMGKACLYIKQLADLERDFNAASTFKGSD